MDTLSSVVGSEHAGESNTSPLSLTEEGLSLLYQVGTYQYKLDRSITTTYMGFTTVEGSMTMNFVLIRHHLIK